MQVTERDTAIISINTIPIFIQMQAVYNLYEHNL